MIDVETTGAKETVKGLETIAAGMTGALIGGMRQSTAYLTNLAKGNLVGYQSPSVGGVDTGQLRGSIQPSVSSTANAVQGAVGSNLERAQWTEYDTRPHWPPIDALQLWAERHGTSAFLVARAISQRGTKGKRFLGRAVDKGRAKIAEFIGRAIGRLLTRK